MFDGRTNDRRTQSAEIHREEHPITKRPRKRAKAYSDRPTLSLGSSQMRSVTTETPVTPCVEVHLFPSTVCLIAHVMAYSGSLGSQDDTLVNAPAVLAHTTRLATFRERLVSLGRVVTVEGQPSIPFLIGDVISSAIKQFTHQGGELQAVFPTRPGAQLVEILGVKDSGRASNKFGMPVFQGHSLDLVTHLSVQQLITPGGELEKAERNLIQYLTNHSTCWCTVDQRRILVLRIGETLTYLLS
jgi:hypothetical protein